MAPQVKRASLIVTSRLADERLRAEALQLGAFDLLQSPGSAPQFPDEAAPAANWA